MSDALSYHFWNNGIVIRHNEEYDTIEGVDDGVIVHLKSGKKVKADCLLYANGRTGNTDTLGLENVGIKTDSRGQVAVNAHYQTSCEHIYAVGDVIGYPSLASAAYDQGRIAALAITTGTSETHLIEDIPTGIYTIPEISSVGKTEQQLFGERAAEIIHIGQAIMEQKGEGNTIEYFVNTTFNYPTMAEAYRVAALNGLNRLF